MTGLGVFIRRAAAYFTDCVFIMIYAALLALMTIFLAPDAELSRAQGYRLSIVTLTGPVVIVFSFLEARFHASPGKAIFGLRVGRKITGPHAFMRSLVRNIGKFLPWEIAHIGIWIIPGQPFVSTPETLSFIFWATSGILVLIQAMLVLFFGVGIHDRVSGLRVRSRFLGVSDPMDVSIKQ